MYVGLASANLIMGNDEKALQAALRAVAEMPENSSGHRLLIVALVRRDRSEEASMAMERLLRIVPDTKLSDVKPISRPLGFAKQFLSDLQTAGYPQ